MQLLVDRSKEEVPCLVSDLINRALLVQAVEVGLFDIDSD